MFENTNVRQVQMFENTNVRKYKSSKILVFENTNVRKYKCSKIHLLRKMFEFAVFSNFLSFEHLHFRTFVPVEHLMFRTFEDSNICIFEHYHFFCGFPKSFFTKINIEHSFLHIHKSVGLYLFMYSKCTAVRCISNLLT